MPTCSLSSVVVSVLFDKLSPRGVENGDSGYACLVLSLSWLSVEFASSCCTVTMRVAYWISKEVPASSTCNHGLSGGAVTLGFSGCLV